MKRHPVAIEAGAEADLEEIVTFIVGRESIERALAVATQIEQAIGRLASFPERGPHPRELLEHGVRDYREVIWKPYRILYRMAGETVVVVLIADGRRDMRGLLARRLLGA
ncbi:MAG: type II toxin-antitoxin system RelE/ParE family toxin [Reyranellaceae bacterium]